MTQTRNSSDPYPLEILDQHVAIIGKTGSGKTYAAKGMVERMLTEGRRICILDPTGAWWGLKSSADGTEAGFPMVIFGGAHADIPINDQMGRALGEFIAQSSVPAIIDLSEMFTGESHRFVAGFAETLYAKNRAPLHLIIDEADEFCLSDDTELLTKEGWRHSRQITVGDQAVCFDPDTARYSYGPVERVIRRCFTGDMVHLATKSLDCLATPDHRVVLRRVQRGQGRYKLYDWTFCQAARVPTCIAIPHGGAPLGPGVEGLSALEARVLGWIITDGSIHDGRKANPKIVIEQSESTVKRGTAMLPTMDEILSRIAGVTRYNRAARITVSGGRTRNHAPTVRWYFGGDASARFLRWLDEDIHRIPRQIIEQGDRAQINALFLGLMEGDGTSLNGRWSHFYPGQNEQLADEFQEICLRLGLSTVKRWVPSIGQWHVHVATERGMHWIGKPKVEQYAGAVWDITVPTGAFVARRNGTIFVTGNCPQRPLPDTKVMLNRVDRIVRRGRIKGFRVMLISQRPAVLHKDVLTQANTLCALRLTGPQDRKALQEWIRGQADTDQGQAVMKSLPRLRTGTGWVWAPELELLTKVAFPAITTLDSSKAPEVGDAPPPTVSLAEVDLGEIRAQFAEAEEEARQNDPEYLRQRIAELESRADVKASVEPSLKAQERAHKSGYDEGWHKGVEAGYGEGWKDGQEARVGRAKSFLTSLEALVSQFAKDVELKQPAVGTPNVAYESPTQPAPQTPPSIRPATKGSSSAPLPKGERAVLIAVAQHRHGCTRSQLTILTGYKRSSRDAYIQRLREKSYVAHQDSRIVATADGIAVLGPDYEPLPTGRALLDWWLRRLPEGERRVLEILVGRWPNIVPRPEIDVATDYARSSRDAYIQRLKARELVTVDRGMIKAADMLFDGGSHA